MERGLFPHLELPWQFRPSAWTVGRRGVGDRRKPKAARRRVGFMLSFGC